MNQPRRLALDRAASARASRSVKFFDAPSQAAEFIGYSRSVALPPAQRKVREKALRAMAAPLQRISARDLLLPVQPGQERLEARELHDRAEGRDRRRGEGPGSGGTISPTLRKLARRAHRRVGVWGLRRAAGRRLHGHSHAHYDHVHDVSTKTAWSLFLLFSADPCVAVIPLLFAAAPLGPARTAGIVFLYELATITTMVALVLPTRAGARVLRSGWLDRYGDTAAGCVIAAAGIVVAALGF